MSSSWVCPSWNGTMNGLFDFSELAEKAGLSPGQLQELESSIRRQYGSDEMMCQLRLLRTLRAIAERAVSVEDAIAEFADRPSAPREAP